MEDEIDLRQYIDTLIRNWKLVIGLPILAVLVTLGVVLTSPRSYKATALVVIARPRYILNFEPKIETATGSNAPTVSPKAYLGLATSDELLVQLQADPALSTLSADQKTVEALRGLLQATAGADPTLLELQVADSDPAHAAEIANAWSNLFVKYVNEIYGSGASTQVVFETQVVSAKAEYESAQAALEDFLRNNQISKLDGEIGIRRTLIDQYRAEQTASRGLALTQQTQTQRQLLTDTYAELLTIEHQQRTMINEAYADLASIERLLLDAQALQEAVSGDASANNAGNALAQLLLRARGLAGTASANLQLQIALDQPTDSVTGEDIKSLIQVLETRKAETQARLDALLQSPDSLALEKLDSRFAVLEAWKAEAQQRIASLSTGLLTDLWIPIETLTEDQISGLIKQYEDESLLLIAQAESERARQRELTQSRDLAWDTYTALTRKLQEKSDEDIVRLASQASVPQKAANSRLTPVALAGAIGLMLGCVVAWGKEWWQGTATPSVPRYPVGQVPTGGQVAPKPAID